MMSAQPYRAYALRADAEISRSTIHEQGVPSTSTPDTDENGVPEVLDIGHLGTAVRILAMAARNGSTTFHERTDLLMQVVSRRNIIHTTVPVVPPHMLYFALGFPCLCTLLPLCPIYSRLISLYLSLCLSSQWHAVNTRRPGSAALTGESPCLGSMIRQSWSAIYRDNLFVLFTLFTGSCLGFLFRRPPFFHAPILGLLLSLPLLPLLVHIFLVYVFFLPSFRFCFAP